MTGVRWDIGVCGVTGSAGCRGAAKPRSTSDAATDGVPNASTRMTRRPSSWLGRLAFRGQGAVCRRGPHFRPGWRARRVPRAARHAVLFVLFLFCSRPPSPRLFYIRFQASLLAALSLPE